MNYPAPRWLFQFQFLLRTGSFTDAAARMQMSQQALSKNMLALEHWAGHALLQRQPLLPTPEGEYLLSNLPTLLHSLRAIDSCLPRQGNRLALGVSNSLPLALLTPTLHFKLITETECELELVSLPDDEIHVLLQAGELDLGLSLRPLVGPGLDSRQGALLEWGFVAAPLVLAQEPPYAMLRHGHALPEAELQCPNLAPLTRLAGEFPYWDLLKSMILKKAGLACLPLSFVAQELEAGTLQLCPEPFAAFSIPLYFTATPALHDTKLAGILREGIGQ